MAFCILADDLKATYYMYVSCFAWAEDMIEGVDCPCRTSLSFDLSFFDMLQRKDKVNTFGIKEDVRDARVFCRYFRGII